MLFPSLVSPRMAACGSIILFWNFVKFFPKRFNMNAVIKDMYGSFFQILIK